MAWLRRPARRGLDGLYRLGSVLERLSPAANQRLLPPLHLRMYYYRSADWRAFQRACDDARLELVSRGLRPEHRVLDIGSGIGNLALGLVGYTEAPYRGLDVHREAVEWCRTHITPRHPAFRFDHVDLASVAYNASGRRPAAAFVFPLDGQSVDFVFLGSVFTHLLPDAVRQYTAEIGRVLTSGGRCIVSCFLVNDERRRPVTQGQAFLAFPIAHESGVCRLHDAAMPESAVAFEEAFLFATFREHGLRVDDIRRGAWWQGRSHDQDVVSLTKI